MNDGHVPVLVEPVVQLLRPAAGETAADLTAGLGGHAEALANMVGPEGTLVMSDLDPANLAAASARVDGLCGRVLPMQGSFVDVPRRMAELGLRANAVLADLGFSSNQVDDAGRGLSFKRDGPLDMRLDPTGPITAAHIVNETPERDLADLIYQYGEERASRRVAGAIVRRRRTARFETTGDLADVVRRAVPGGHRSRIDPATRTFQALRIAVNGELDALESLLSSVERGARSLVQRGGAEDQPSGWLSAGARVGIISFHSLEDRPVKRAMQAWESAGLGRRVTRKPIVAGEAESSLNSRARSAKFRVFAIAGEPVARV